VHFEAPPSKQVAKEMKAFIQWFNNSGPGGTQEIKLAAVRSAIAQAEARGMFSCFNNKT
jgi:hypothetical protein